MCCDLQNNEEVKTAAAEQNQAEPKEPKQEPKEQTIEDKTDGGKKSSDEPESSKSKELISEASKKTTSGKKAALVDKELLQVKTSGTQMPYCHYPPIPYDISDWRPVFLCAFRLLGSLTEIELAT